MGQRWFTLAVGVMWMTSMGWLVSTKLWPLLGAGTPPSNLTVYTQQNSSGAASLPPIGWSMTWGNKPLGWAVSSSSINSEGFTTIQSHAHFDRIPFEELLPIPLQPLIPQGSNRGISMEADSRLIMDAEGHLNRISFIITTPEFQKPIRVEGHVKNNKFLVTLFPGTGDRLPRWELPADAVIGNDLTPLVRLPNLSLDQTWNIRVYNHFGIGANSGLEMVQAKVERSDILHWEDTDRRVWLVVMRRDTGSVLRHLRSVSGRMWVDYDGTVLQQESYLSNSKLTFTRVQDSKALELYQQSVAIRQRRLRDYDSSEFNPEDIPEDKVEIFSIGGTNSVQKTLEAPAHSRHGWNRGPGMREGRSRRHEVDIWGQVERYAQPHDPAATPTVDPFDQEDEEQFEPTVPSNDLPTESDPLPAIPAQP